MVGTIGAISQDEYNEHKDEGYALNDKIGKSGIESALEDYLRGVNGEKVVETTAGGSQVGVNYTKNAVAGNTVYLTIDAQLQAVVNKSLAENIQATREAGQKKLEQTGKDKTERTASRVRPWSSTCAIFPSWRRPAIQIMILRNMWRIPPITSIS